MKNLVFEGVAPQYRGELPWRSMLSFRRLTGPSPGPTKSESLGDGPQNLNFKPASLETSIYEKGYEIIVKNDL